LKERPVEEIQVTATFPKITPDNLAEFKRIAGDALKITAEDPGVRQFDWFFNADESACVVREIYASSEALLAHLGMVGEILGPVVELGGGIQIEIFGSPSEQLVQAFEAFHPEYYSYFQGK
jgi:N-acetyl-anhydromuramyl-L-alanine amidase AmpD